MSLFLELSLTELTEDPILESEDSLSETTLIPATKRKEEATNDKPEPSNESGVEFASVPGSAITRSY